MMFFLLTGLVYHMAHHVISYLLDTGCFFFALLELNYLIVSTDEGKKIMIIGNGVGNRRQFP